MVSLQPSTSFSENEVGLLGLPLLATYPMTWLAGSMCSPSQAAGSTPENKAWPCSVVSYLHRGLGNMWSELHFMKAAATHDTLSILGDLWGCVVLMLSVGLLSSPCCPGHCL